MPRTDQFLVAVVCVPRAISNYLGGLAFAAEPLNILVNEFSIGIAVSKTLALRPNAGVNDADDNPFTSSRALLASSWTAKLFPKAACVSEAEKSWCAGCVGIAELVRCHRENVALFRESRGLFLSKLRGKAIEAVRVVVNLRATAGFLQSFVVFSLEITDVTQSVRCQRINLLAVARFCGVVARHI